MTKRVEDGTACKWCGKKIRLLRYGHAYQWTHDDMSGRECCKKIAEPEPKPKGVEDGMGERSVREVAKEAGFQPVSEAESNRRFDSATRVAMEARLIQELPARPKIRSDEHYNLVFDAEPADAYMDALEAESAALHETIATLRADATKAAEELALISRNRDRHVVNAVELMRQRDEARAELSRVQEDNTHEVIRGVALRYKERLEKAESELARERERHRQAVETLGRFEDAATDYQEGLLVRQAIALLEPAPVATGEEK